MTRTNPLEDLIDAIRPAWWREAACRGRQTPAGQIGPDWHPGPSDTVARQLALAVCHTCPHEAACLEWALTRKEPHGIWGGRTENDRRRIRRRTTLTAA